MSEKSWTCFHCGQVCVGVDAARLHFGGSERQRAACQIDIAEYRLMEEVNRRHCEEDTDLHRLLYARQSDHETALLRAEESGYAKGLAALKGDWTFERGGDSISVINKSGMGVVVRESSQGAREIPEEVLYALAVALGA